LYLSKLRHNLSSIEQLWGMRFLLNAGKIFYLELTTFSPSIIPRKKNAIIQLHKIAAHKNVRDISNYIKEGK